MVGYVHSVPVPLCTRELAYFAIVILVAFDGAFAEYIAINGLNGHSATTIQDAVPLLEFYHAHGGCLIIMFHIVKILFNHDLEFHSSSFTLDKA